jgi:hypothetical protein
VHAACCMLHDDKVHVLYMHLVVCTIAYSYSDCACLRACFLLTDTALCLDEKLSYLVLSCLASHTPPAHHDFTLQRPSHAANYPCAQSRLRHILVCLNAKPLALAKLIGLARRFFPWQALAGAKWYRRTAPDISRIKLWQLRASSKPAKGERSAADIS